MAQEPRSKTNGKPPIMRHPLFPATVALWFGALFGLGSLAIRPGLLESAVLALHLDAFIAAAAPPLGVTARILLATCMAAFGCFLGAAIARRISRPKPVVRERMRGASAVGNAHKPAQHMHAYAIDGETEGAASGDTPRRRQLAVKEHEVEGSRPEFRESAPVPGGSPQILDVSEFDLEGFQAEEAGEQVLVADQQDEAEHELPQQDDGIAHDHDETVQQQFIAALPEDSQVSEPSPAARPDQAEPAGTGVDNGTEWKPEEMQTAEEPAQFESAPAPELASHKNGLFETYSQGIAANHGAVAPSPAPFAQPEAEAARDVANEPASLHLERSDLAGEQAPVAQSSGYRSIFEPNPAPRLFAEPAHAQTAEIQLPTDNKSVPPASASFTQPDVEQVSAGDEDTDAEPRPTALFDRPASSEAPEPSWTDASSEDGQPSSIEHRLDDNAVPGHTSAQPLAAQCNHEPMPEASAAERIATAELDELSQVELLERLALSLQRRSERKSPAEGSEATAAAASPAVVETECDFAAEAPDSASAQERSAERGADHPGASAPPPFAIPAAMKPVGLGEDDESELLPSFVPPRHISMPQQPAAPQTEQAPDETFASSCDGEESPEMRESAIAPFAGPMEGQDADDSDSGDDSRVLEEGYSSLLDLSRPAAGKQKFVRIEEPEHLDGEVEPVVIFPGRENAGDGPFARPASAAAETPPFARPETSGETSVPSEPTPVAASQDQQAAPFAPPAKRQDPEETERALRAALATLQRMSGAA